MVVVLHWLCLCFSHSTTSSLSRETLSWAEPKYCLVSWAGKDTHTCSLLFWQRVGNFWERAGANNFLKLNQLKIQSETYPHSSGRVRFDTSKQLDMQLHFRSNLLEKVPFCVSSQICFSLTSLLTLRFSNSSNFI